ncbi:hypothetical protein CLV58_109166 [Spirosoma oryzae]|uniref:Uncharacterized protein n=1 Tax=Spirosoma oryzae TaxID=1469603 RepID=A0A2T0SYH3_9BACT|nr:hypothetical protein [Spirosoma oryzae]PRY38439.1 hypothetical protein CLV58_109166 [Spirosoma oryzae]
MTRHHLELLSLPATDETILLQDLSVYNGYPEYPRLVLTVPGRNSCSVPIKPGETTVIRPLNPGELLPDGIYTADYSVTPHDQIQLCYPFLRTYQLECRLNRWIQTIDWLQEPVTSRNYQTLQKVTALLLAATSSVQAGDLAGGQRYFQGLQTTCP